MRLFHRIVIKGLILLLLVSAAALPLWAQPAPIPYHKEPYRLDSGVYEGLEAETALAFQEVIQVTGAPWLRVHISDCNLGQKSYITFTSLQDGGWQRLDSKTVPQWGYTSAYLNGDAVLVELHAASGEQGLFFRVEEITVGEWLGAAAGDESLLEDMGIESICGTDNRTPSTDDRSGRLTFVLQSGNPDVACSCWLISNGALLTAGHCVDFDPDGFGSGLPDGVLDLDDNDVIEFDVPDSQADGTLVFANPNNQYAINLNSVSWNFDGEGEGLGKDWAVFSVFANPNTDLTPHQAQGTFYRTSNDNPTTAHTIRITGYGTDSSPSLTRNQVQQTDTGPYQGESSSGANFWHRYRVDTTGGSSGSPIIWENNGFTLGIHTNAGCTSTGGENKGTSFEHNPLENALEDFPGSGAVYVDRVRLGTLENGTIFHPYDTVTEAVNTVSTNGIISIVTGSYTKSAGNTFTIGADGKRVTIVAPVGNVYIGN